MRMNKDRLTALAVISPSLLLLAVFIYGFIGQTVYNSMTNWGGAGQAALSQDSTISFIFLKNYQDLFTGLLNVQFRYDLVNTIFFTVLFLTACLGLGLFMAILLDQKIRGEGIFRTIFLFPMALSFVVTGTIWRWLFTPNGGLNVLPTVIGLPKLDFQWFIDRNKLMSFTWQQALLGMGVIIALIMVFYLFQSRRQSLLSSRALWIIGFALLAGLFIVGALQLPTVAEYNVAAEKHGFNVAMISIVIAAVWQMSGYTMAIYLAGLRGIPDELREAARVDGCNEFQVYRYVIFPLLQPITLSAAIILGHISLKIFDLVYVMAGGRNLQVDVPGVNMYLTAFQANKFALGSAMAVIMLIMVAVIIVPYLITQLREEK